MNGVNPELARQRELIAVQREELSRTIQVLADKVDVPARAREAVASARDRMRAVARQYTRPGYALGAVAVVSAVVSVIAFSSWWRSRR
jgi:hypothetical protein